MSLTLCLDHSYLPFVFACLLGNNEANCVEVRSAFPLSTINEAPLMVLQFIACFIGVSCALTLAIIAYEKYLNRKISRPEPHQASSINDRDLEYTLEVMGKKSVYQFFIGKSVLGWLIVTVTIAAQIWILSVFVDGSKRDPSNPTVDMLYTWKCSRDQDSCFDTRARDCEYLLPNSLLLPFFLLPSQFLPVNWKGWLAVAILLLLYLLKDAINGIKMLKYATKQRHGLYGRIRLLIGGTVLTLIAMFTTYATILYNSEIASSKLFQW